MGQPKSHPTSPHSPPDAPPRSPEGLAAEWAYNAKVMIGSDGSKHLPVLIDKHLQTYPDGINDRHRRTK